MTDGGNDDADDDANDDDDDDDVDDVFVGSKEIELYFYGIFPLRSFPLLRLSLSPPLWLLVRMLLHRAAHVQIEATVAHNVRGVAWFQA